jgi:TPR repeat protein
MSKLGIHHTQRNGVIVAAIIGAIGVVVGAYIQRPRTGEPNASQATPGERDAGASKPTPPAYLVPETPLKALTTRAEAGELVAQVELADLYYDGRGVQRNYSRAFYWYRQAAVAGDVTSKTQLGWMYTRGIGTRADREQAAQWFRVASEEGDARAQNYLGWAYVQGWGVPLDYTAARHWLAKAAAANDRIGLYNYGVLHERGLGAPPNTQTAIELYKRSAAAGYADARDALRRLGVK